MGVVEWRHAAAAIALAASAGRIFVPRHVAGWRKADPKPDRAEVKRKAKRKAQRIARRKNRS